MHMSKPKSNGQDPNSEGPDPTSPRDYAPRFPSKDGANHKSFYQSRGYIRWLKQERSEGRIRLGDMELLQLLHDEIGYSWPSLRRGWVKVTAEQVARELGASERSVKERMSRLVEDGYLKRKKASAAEEPQNRRTSRRGFIYRAAPPWEADPQAVRQGAKKAIHDRLEALQNGDVDPSEEEEYYRRKARQYLS